ncbi:hypothetical protein ECG_09420 [Echinococcus granulosus]|nr:hypothetical protein ECG_09420 [Echinococcus granulosus]
MHGGLVKRRKPRIVTSYSLPPPHQSDSHMLNQLFLPRIPYRASVTSGKEFRAADEQTDGYGMDEWMHSPIRRDFSRTSWQSPNVFDESTSSVTAHDPH